MKHQHLLKLCSGITACLLSEIGFADTATVNVPVNASSSFEIRQAQPDLLQRRQDDGSVNVPTAPVYAAPQGAENVQFVLHSVRLNGNRVISSQQLAKTWQPLLNQQVTLTQVYALANALTEIYQQQGYVLSQVIVPEQTVKNGHVTLQVIEGYIRQVELTGEQSQHPLLQRYAENIKTEKPITGKTLERFLLLYNDLGGVTSQSFVKATDQAGALDLVVVAQDKPVQYSIGVHNRVSESVGNLRFESYVIVGNVLGLMEQHYVGINSSLDKKSNTLVYQTSVPIGGDGLQASAAVSGSWVKPELGGQQVSDSQSLYASLGLNFPAIRSRDTNIYGYTSLDMSNNQSDRFNTRTNDEKTRSITAGVRAEILDDWKGINQFDYSSSLGLDGLGASQQGDTLLSGVAGQGNPQFLKQNLYAARLQYLGNSFSLLSAVSGQWTKDKLLSGQQFTLGGNNFLRAYDPGEIAGDRGVAAKLELRHQASVWNTDLTSYGFYDWGEVRAKSLKSNGNIAYREDRAQSAGLGIRFSTRFGINGYVEASKPIERKTSYDQSTDPRLFAGLSFEY